LGLTAKDDCTAPMITKEAVVQVIYDVIEEAIAVQQKKITRSNAALWMWENKRNVVVTATGIGLVAMTLAREYKNGRCSLM
jgi:ubiquinone/menaquinone biosynthesis C-methylase UbiE